LKPRELEKDLSNQIPSANVMITANCNAVEEEEK
jgi:hypothetical protein